MRQRRKPGREDHFLPMMHVDVTVGIQLPEANNQDSRACNQLLIAVHEHDFFDDFLHLGLDRLYAPARFQFPEESEDVSIESVEVLLRRTTRYIVDYDQQRSQVCSCQESRKHLGKIYQLLAANGSLESIPRD